MKAIVRVSRLVIEQASGTSSKIGTAGCREKIMYEREEEDEYEERKDEDDKAGHLDDKQGSCEKLCRRR
ncbi:MAG: hypothetical protein ABC596_05970 [Candidatus Methanosuratincola petrocarbonis]